MSMTPDERRRVFVEPGMTRLFDEQGRPAGVAIDVRRSDAYSGNGISVEFDGPIATGGPVLVLTPAALRRLGHLAE